MGKGENARYEQFLLFPQCFQKACFPGASKGVIVWEWVKEIMIINDREVIRDAENFDIVDHIRYSPFLSDVYGINVTVNHENLPIT